MNIEKERKAFEKWYQETHKPQGDWNAKGIGGGYNYATTDFSWMAWLARAEIDAKPDGHLCRIIQGDFSTGIITLEMSDPDFSVSAGPKLLCDATEAEIKE